MSDLVGNPEDRFYHNEAQIIGNRNVCPMGICDEGDELVAVHIVLKKILFENNGLIIVEGQGPEVLYKHSGHLL